MHTKENWFLLSASQCMHIQIMYRKEHEQTQTVYWILAASKGWN